jgi:ribosomal protein S27AE
MNGIFWNQTDTTVVKDTSLKTLNSVQSLSTELLQQEKRIDKLIMINQALWFFLKEHLNLTEDELFTKVEEIDLLDGKLDGKVKIQAKKCPKCGRVVSLKHDKCLYCGAEHLAETIFETI